MTVVDRSSRLPARWGWQSLRTRVMLAILVWVAFGISGIWFSATRLFAQHVEEQYHEELSVHVRELAGLVRINSDGSAFMTRPLSDPRYLEPLSGFYWEVSIDRGATLRSPSLTRGSLDNRVAHSSQVLHVVEDGPTGPTITYGFVRPADDGRYVHYLIATDKRLLDNVIRGFTQELTIWLAVLALALVATGLAIVTFGFRPFDRVASSIAALRAGRQDALAGTYPSEVTPLVEDLNAYIEHNAKVVVRGRVEAGNLAHFLRTPLAVIIDEAERLSQRPDVAESAEVLLRQSQLIAQQVEFRMARAGSAAGARAPGVSCRLSDVLPPVISAMRRLYPDIAISLEGADDQDAALPMDAIDCTEMLSNLIDNAGKWARSAVTVSIADGAVSIADDGPGLSPEQIAKAFEIGMRFDPGKPGSGLGLAIARDIAETYGLALELTNNGPAAPGLTARVTVMEG